MNVFYTCNFCTSRSYRMRVKRLWSYTHTFLITLNVTTLPLSESVVINSYFIVLLLMSRALYASRRRQKVLNKSPAVARVSRPRSWCTLATCVHNCPSMMFRTCCCLRPKCKRTYLLIYMTSDTS